VTPVRVLLADDQALFREALATLLEARPEVEVVGEAGNGAEALDRAATLGPDVVLMDLHMPVLDGVAAARRGESVLHPSVAAKVVAQFARLSDDPRPRPQPLIVPLSDRELDVVRLLAGGRSNREIAQALFLAEGTVKNHVTNVLAKLGARDRTQAALRARALDLL
jgi:DNA-binding NarL/FixJ family response regulator